MFDRIRDILRSRRRSSLPRQPVDMDFGALGEAYARGWRGGRCLFVLSTGRTGTMTLSRALAQSPHLRSYHEPLPTLANASLRAYQNFDRQYDDPDAWDGVIDAARAELVWEAWQDGKAYVETNNRLSYLAPSIARFFPESRFIFLHRHPHEVIRSGLRRSWYRSNPWDWCRIRPRPGGEWGARWDTMRQAEKIAWLWMEVNRVIRASLARLDRDRWMVVRSADLFAEGETTIAGICRFLDVPVVRGRAVRSVLSHRLNAQHGPGADVPASTNAIMSAMARELGYDV